MQYSSAPATELKAAQEAVTKLRESRSFVDFEEAWKEYLRRVERCWNKASAHYKKSPKWHSWKGNCENLRKTDPLLAYLRNARGADEHTVEPIITGRDGSMGINAPPGSNTLYIKSLTWGKDGTMRLDAPRGATVVFIPKHTALLPVVNRGVTYPIPIRHLDLSVDPSDVPGVASLGLKFYENFLKTAEANFVTE